MIFNKEKRTKYLGFDDIWFMIIGILIVSIITNFLFNDSFGRVPVREAIIGWCISLFFTVVHWVIMRQALIFLRKRYPAFKDSTKRIITLLIAVVVSVFIIDFFGNFILSIIIGEDYHPANLGRIAIPIILISTMIQATYEAIYYYIRLQKSIRDEEQTKQAIVQAQLDALSNQSQPHFFFNTLNTLKDIIDQNSKEDAKEFVDKLSDIYRFILETGKTNLISLSQEIKFSKSYIHIQKERFGDNLIVNWDIPEDVHNKNIVPMSTQLLLENAIKHNVVSRSSPLQIDIYIENDNLIIKNKLKLKSTVLPSTKIGLKNIQKRYELITSKSIIIEDNGQYFSVSLPILDSKNN